MTPDPWWRTAVIYQVYIRSFADGDGDGIGDIAGIRARLPYLAELGVDAIWINPWYPSPQADAGYDVADYRGIEPTFGTVADAEALIADAHGHGLRVILDIVPNHTSDQHVWFQQALAEPGTRGRYIFRPGRGPAGSQPPNNWQSVFGGPAWTRITEPDGTPGQWYLHLFAPEQPDLNWADPEVRAEFADVLKFWFARGVDGFRIDVAHGLAKDPTFPDAVDTADMGPFHPGHPAWDQDQVHEIYRKWRQIADACDPPRIFVGEAWVAPAERLARYVRDDELHTAFNFEFLRAPWDAAAMRASIDSTIAGIAAVGAPCTWVLSNHDVIREATRYGRPSGHENDPAGVVPADLEVGQRRARAAALLMLALPGGAYIYQGEELGLPEVEDLPVESLADPRWEQSQHTDRGRDGCRVPIPWSPHSPTFGFGPEASSTSWLPQPPTWKQYAAVDEAADPESTLSLYRRALRLRRCQRWPEALTWVEAGASVLAFRRGADFLCVVNLSGASAPLPPHESILAASGPVEGTLPPDTAAWLRTTREED